MNLIEGAVFKLCKARFVLLALRAAVSADLDHLETQGFIETVQHADWASPLVLVRNKDGTIRLCGDYRSTVNAASKTASYPLSMTSEVMANLRKGTLFSTLDLYQAYK